MFNYSDTRVKRDEINCAIQKIESKIEKIDHDIDKVNGKIEKESGDERKLLLLLEKEKELRQVWKDLLQDRKNLKAGSSLLAA